MKKAVCALLGTLLVSPVLAEDVVLKCVTAEGTKAADLTINLATKRMTWSVIGYRIVHVDSDYITAIKDQQDKMGGDIWVLHRSSGKYWRVAIGEYCDGKDCGSTRTAAVTYEGTCRKNML